MQWKTTNSNERLINAVESAGIPTDGKTRNPGEEKEELHGKAITFTVYWENRRSEEPGTGYRQDCWKKKLMDANICTMQDQTLRTNSIREKMTNRVHLTCLDYVEKDEMRKISVMWLQNVKCLHSSVHLVMCKR